MIDEKTEKKLQIKMMELTDSLINEGAPKKDAVEYSYLWKLQMLTKLASSERRRWELLLKKMQPFLKG